MTASSDRLNSIACSVGILTFNSEQTLRRALESVKDFSDIIIADGGSTDGTLAIAREYGATIIEQIAKTKPGPEPRHPIEDFATERNQLIEKAIERWYLWIDSDEYISKVLHDEIATLVSEGSTKSGYRVPMVLQSKDASVTYRSPQQIYQMRLFDLSTGGRFQRPIHERYVFPANHASDIGTLTGAWYVPISKPDFATHRFAVNYRLGKLAAANPPHSLSVYLKRGVFKPLRNVAGILVRLARSYLTIPWSQVLPLYYFRNRLYSQWVTFKVVSKLYFTSKKHD